jgi:ABC-type Fe3+/spermidine/putrescine transport system ATPase subunit
MELIMPCVELRGIRNFICRDINLRVEKGEFVVLLGPNGAGKTTLLNIIAGLVEYEGSVLFDGSSMDRVPSHLRRIGYIFQDLALFPHLDVKANIAFGLRAQKKDPLEIKERVRDMLHLVRIENLAHRYPLDLSGGERQRVAIARALAPNPQALLLDEPFNSLDYGTSKYLRMELKGVQRNLGITTIYVTHNQREAEELGDKIAVVHHGEIAQVGTPEEVFFAPLSEQISEFIGSPNIFRCEHSRELGRGLAEVTCKDLSIVVPDDGSEITKVAILPRDIYISTSEPPGPDVNRYTGKIIEMRPSLNLTWIRLRVGEHTLVAEHPTERVEELGLRVGDEVYIILKLRWIRVLSTGENRLNPD